MNETEAEKETISDQIKDNKKKTFNTDRTQIRSEEGPKVLAAPPDSLHSSSKLSFAVEVYTWVKTIGATMAIFEFPSRTPLDLVKSPKSPQ